MINPYAETFMIAARTRGAAHWEQPHFANRRDAEPTPVLTSGPRSKRRLWPFGRRTDT